MNQPADRPDPGVGRRLWWYISSPGALWWGLPVGIGSAVWLHGRDFGFTLPAFLRLEFAIRLAVGLILGIIGGNVFQAAARGLGMSMDHLPGTHRDPPA